jgi:diguanylate cyclase (GGDEF)-like protein
VQFPSNNALRLLLVLSASMFVAEMAVMLGLQYFVIENQMLEALADAGALTVLLFPVLYFGVFRPLQARNQDLARAEQNMRDAQHLLEERIEERTRDLVDSNQHLKDSVSRLAVNKREMAILGEMSQMFQVCRNLEEAYRVASGQLSILFPNNPGVLYLFRSSRNVLERVAEWNDKGDYQEFFAPEDCWALRRGKLHMADPKSGGLHCDHAGASENNVCLPMTAGGETLGLLSLRLAKGDADNGERSVSLADDEAQFLTAVAESLALAIANIRLRETLRQQAFRDKLTGLYNRRFIDESIELELHRAKREDKPLSVIMLDVDHFKRYNDTFGHDAGDAVLAELGRLLSTKTRASDVPCRYGGEEFLVIMSGADTAQALSRAETLRCAVEELSVVQDGKPLGSVTISCGIATYPQHGDISEDLLRVADTALYAAKHAGRNRVVEGVLPGADVDGAAASDRELATVAAKG